MTGLLVDSEEHAMVRGTVADIAEKYGLDYYLEKSRSHSDIEELWKELGASGLLGVHLPEEHGGGGAGLGEAVVVIEELAAHGMPILNMVISPVICGSIIAAHGSPEMKHRWLPALADGSASMSFGLTEPDAGSNSHKVSTTARRSGDGWVLSGSKYYISAIDRADALLLVARDEDAEVGPSGRAPLTLFVVPVPSPGLSYQVLETAVVSPEHQFTVFLDEVRVGPDAVVGQPGKGLQQVFAGLNPERITAAAISNGIGRYAVGKAVAYAQQRTVWSVPIGSHQGISHPLAQAHIEVELARLATARAAELADSGQDAAGASNIAKFAAAEASLKALDQAIQTHGGNGLALEYGLTHLWFAARLMRSAPVSREMVLNYVAQTSLGLPRSY